MSASSTLCCLHDIVNAAVIEFNDLLIPGECNCSHQRHNHTRRHAVNGCHIDIELIATPLNNSVVMSAVTWSRDQYRPTTQFGSELLVNLRPSPIDDATLVAWRTSRRVTSCSVTSRWQITWSTERRLHLADVLGKFRARLVVKERAQSVTFHSIVSKIEVCFTSTQQRDPIESTTSRHKSTTIRQRLRMIASHAFRYNGRAATDRPSTQSHLSRRQCAGHPTSTKNCGYALPSWCRFDASAPCSSFDGLWAGASTATRWRVGRGRANDWRRSIHTSDTVALYAHCAFSGGRFGRSSAIRIDSNLCN